MIQGYVDESSAFPGETIIFRVSSPDAPQFRIDLYRQGVAFEFLLSTGWMPGRAADEHTHDQDWSLDGTRPDGAAAPAWPAYPFQLPTDWRSGVYIAIFVEGDGQGNPNPNQSPPIDAGTADARSGKALFVVKNPAPGVASQLLYKLPLFTYTAYNPKGGASVYQSTVNQIKAVSLHRPGNGTGGFPWDADPAYLAEPNLDVFDLATLRQTFVHWDAKLIAWLEDPAQGYSVDYCTDLDVHNDDDLALLSPYALVLSVGHDEYYTPKMRDHLEAYIANGGNMAFFSGNTCWWRVVFTDLQNPVVFYRHLNWYVGPAQGQPDGPNRPEDALTGVSYRNAGEKDHDRPKVGYTVQHTELWPFEGTGLAEGDTFGAEQALVGYECDGTPYDKNAPRPVAPRFDPADHTPAGFIILGTGDTSIWPGNPVPSGNLAATMGLYTNGGAAFTGATTDWPRVVWEGEPHTVRITRNVLDRLGGNPKGLAALARFDNILACDGFYSPDDGYRHAIVVSGDGGISEVFFNPQQGQGQTLLATQPGLLDVGAFYSDDDGYRHAVTVGAGGAITEVFYSPATGLGQATLATIPNAARVCGFYSDDDGYRHAIVATADGNLFEVFFSPGKGQGQALLGTFTGIVDIGGFYSPDDGYRHVLVGTANGDVTEVYYSPAAGIHQVVIATVPGLTRLSAYYAAGDPFYNRRVQVATQGGRLHEIRYHPNFGIMRVVLFNTGGLRDVGGFFSPDDAYRHAILAAPTGDVQELFFRP